MSYLSILSTEAPILVRRIYCVGRNYAEHRAEMGGTDRDEPFFFHKPSDAVVQPTSQLVHHVKYPKGTSCFSYEAELVVLIGPRRSVIGYGVGVDFTKRDRQAEAKKLGRPWEIGKSFDNSALVGDIVKSPLQIENAYLKFELNGETKQSACISQMIWPVSNLIDKLVEQDFSVQHGDVIFTGTPAGVGTLVVGDSCSVKLVDQQGTNIVPELKFVVEQ